MSFEKAMRTIEDYNDLSDRIEARWKDFIGWGCGYFDHFEINGNTMIVYYDRPRNGGMDADEIAIEEFADILSTIEEL